MRIVSVNIQLPDSRVRQLPIQHGQLRKYANPRANDQALSLYLPSLASHKKNFFFKENSYLQMTTFAVVQWLFVTPWTVAYQAPLFFTLSQSLLKFMFIELMMLSNHLILCRPLLLLPSIFPSVRVLSNESVLCIRGPKYWSFSFSNSPSNEHSGLISFRIDWLP